MGALLRRRARPKCDSACAAVPGVARDAVRVRRAHARDLCMARVQRDHIFRNVAVLIYVFDVESRQMKKDIQVRVTQTRCFWIALQPH